jgi:Protein of unknown function (DUF1360)
VPIEGDGVAPPPSRTATGVPLLPLGRWGGLSKTCGLGYPVGMPSAEKYSPQDPQPLGGYAALTLIFNALVAILFVARRRSQRELPDQIPFQDIALLGVGTFKLSRLITKDKVMSWLRSPFTRYESKGRPSEVEEKPRGEGLQQAVGQLITCPYCAGQWIATGLLAVYLWQPRATRAATSTLAIATAADYLQQAWAAVDKRA